MHAAIFRIMNANMDDPEKLSIESSTRIRWLKAIVCAGFVCGLVLSVHLWLDPRFYPRAPLFDFALMVPDQINWLLVGALFVALGATAFIKKSEKIVWATILLVIILVIFDQSRLQPWVLQYLFLLAAVGLFYQQPHDSINKETILNTTRLIVACIYFWSGLQKVSSQFTDVVFPWVVAPIAQVFPDFFAPFFYVAGFLVPIIEIMIGITLATRRFRILAITGAATMCLFVLWSMGPFGNNWNSVVWPWNIAMLAIVVILFWRSQDVSMSDIIWNQPSTFHIVSLILFGLLPLLSFFNYWDSYLSWSLYSGTISEATVYISADVNNRLPQPVRGIVRETDGGELYIDPATWSFQELNVPPYPEARIYRVVARKICAYAVEPTDVRLIIKSRWTWFAEQNDSVFDCSQLKKR